MKYSKISMSYERRRRFVRARMLNSNSHFPMSTWRRGQNAKRVLCGHISLDVTILMVLLNVASVENA